MSTCVTLSASARNFQPAYSTLLTRAFVYLPTTITNTTINEMVSALARRAGAVRQKLLALQVDRTLATTAIPAPVRSAAR